MRPLAVIDGLLTFFAPDDPVFTRRHPDVNAKPAACGRSGEGEKTSLQPTEENSSLGVYFNLLFSI